MVVHHLLLIGVGQRLGLVGVAELMVLHAMLGEVLHSGVVDDDARAVGLPRRAAQVLLIDASVRAHLGVGRGQEDVVAQLRHLCGGEALPVVGALGGVLHHLHLRQVGTVGKCLVANLEVEGQQGVVVVGVGVLEVEGFQRRAVVEGTRRNHGQVGVGAPVAHEVVVYLHAVVVVVALLVAGDDGNLRGIAVGIVGQQVVGAALGAAVEVVLKVPALGADGLVAEVVVVVLAREVAVGDAPEGALGLGGGNAARLDDETHGFRNVLQLVLARGLEAVADKHAGIGQRAPVVEGRTLGHGDVHHGTCGPVVLAAKLHRGVAGEGVGAAVGHGDAVEDEGALRHSVAHGAGVAAVEGDGVVGAIVALGVGVVEGRAAEAVELAGVQAVGDALAVGSGVVAPADEGGGVAVLAARRHVEGAVEEAARQHVLRLVTVTDEAAGAQRAVAQLLGDGGRDAAVVDGVGSDGGTVGHTGAHQSCGVQVAADAARDVQVADGGPADVAEGRGEGIAGVDAHTERVAVAVVDAGEGLFVCSHHGGDTRDVSRLAEILAAVGVALRPCGQCVPVSSRGDEPGVAARSRAAPAPSPLRHQHQEGKHAK